MLQEQWNNVLSNLQNQVTAITFDLWISKLKPVSFHNDELVLVAPNSSVKHQATSSNILSKLQTAVHSVFNLYTEVRIVEENELHNIQPVHIVEQTVDNKEQSKFIQKYTFENFVVGKSNQFVHAAMRSIAENPSSRFNPLFIYGGVGLGKTHLLHAVGNYLTKHRPELNVLYATCEKFTNDYSMALRAGNPDVLFREKYRNVDVLMIDDIQFISKKMSIQEEFFHTFNELYQNNKQIIIASDRSPHEIPVLEDRLRSRFSSGLIQDLQTPDYETRVAILSTKASQEGYLVDDEVIDFIAQKLDLNIREMEGLLSKVVFYSQLNSKTCATMIDAREALKDIDEPEKESLDAEKIIQTVCQFFKISKEDMLGRRRNNEIAEPRQLCMYLISDMIDMPLKAIGTMFDRDHSTVVHARDKITKQIKTNQKTKTIISDLKSQILKY
ncbi:MAG: chromosomal replication initiator protein DnaA [Clostridia bacterium]|nr:chromosomal replication initiator protein DnaA [Clostridia bacterium]MBQ8522262.1 chromosomal replication initiator protein DnaA [Clostridia bacterium]